MEAITFLTYLAVLLLLGIICTLISQKIKIPNILLLIIIGMLLGKIKYQDKLLMEFPPLFLTSIGILALVMIIFDSSSRFKLKEFDTLSLNVLKLTGIFLFLNLIFLTIATIFVLGMEFNVYSILVALLFAALMSGTDPAAILTMFKQTKNKILELLEIESLVNTPMIVLLPFIILDLMNRIKTEAIAFSQFFDQILPLLQDFILRLIAGIGAGILIGLLVFKMMKRKYSEILSPLAVITAALLAYILAENFGGNGVLAVTTMGLFFGNVYLKQKMELQEFSLVFANSLEILVFILIGFIITLPLNPDFFMRSIALFIIYLIIRYFAIEFSFKKEYNLKEKIFMALNAQKGIAVAVVAFTLTILNTGELSMILNMILAFMLYSIIVSTVVVKFSRYFVRTEIKQTLTKMPQKTK